MTCKHEKVIKRTFMTFTFYQCAECKAEVNEIGEVVKADKDSERLPKGFTHLLRKEGFKEPAKGEKVKQADEYFEIVEFGFVY